MPCRDRAKTAKTDCLLAKVKIGYHLTVTIDIDIFYIIQYFFALAYKHKQSTARVLILGMQLKMAGKIGDSAAENCNLNFGFTGILVRTAELLDNFCFMFFCKAHSSSFVMLNRLTCNIILYTIQLHRFFIFFKLVFQLFE